MEKGRIEKRFLIGLIGVVLLLTIFPFSGYTEIPPKINYQGYLTNAAGVPINGTIQMVLSIYDVPTNGIPLWTETQNVSVSHGVYNVNLEDVNPINLLFDKPYYLGVKVGTDPEMTPRKPLTTVPYAFRAEYGLQGPVGPQGPIGLTGPAGPAGVGIKPIQCSSGEAVVEIASDGTPMFGSLVTRGTNIVTLPDTIHTYIGTDYGAGSLSIDGDFGTYQGTAIPEAEGKPIDINRTCISQHIFSEPMNIYSVKYRLYSHTRYSFQGSSSWVLRLEYTSDGSSWSTIPGTEIAGSKSGAGWSESEGKRWWLDA